MESDACLEKFVIYETQARFYIVGRGKNKDQKRILKIDRSEPSELVLVEDPTVYSDRQCSALLQQLAEGNRSSGGLRLVTKAYGIVGCIRFLEPWYLILVRRRRQVGSMRGHAVWRIEESQVLTVPHAAVQTDVAKSNMEQRYKRLLSGVDLTRDFFYSHSYPIMRSLQDNVCRTVTGCTECPTGSTGFPAVMAHEPRLHGHMAHEHMFVWNAFLTRPIRHALSTSRWTLALSHGFFHQERMSIFGRVISLVLIARRSRHFAGTRYLKRGVNDRGRVANEVEVEQVLLDHCHEPVLPREARVLPVGHHEAALPVETVPPRETALPRGLMLHPASTSIPAPPSHLPQHHQAFHHPHASHQNQQHHHHQYRHQQADISPPPSPASSSPFLFVQPVPPPSAATSAHATPISPKNHLSQVLPTPGVGSAGAATAAAAAVAVAAVGAASAAALPAMASVVQVRGSIPLFWSQEASRLSPKPDIVLHRYDPMYAASRLHFENLMERYGRPVIILNLIKTVEKHPREMILRREFATAVTYLNRVLPPQSALTYIHWDFSRYAKSANAAATTAGVATAAAGALNTLTSTPNTLNSFTSTPTTLYSVTSAGSTPSSFPSSALIPPSSPSASSFSLSPPPLSPRVTDTRRSSGSSNNIAESSSGGTRGGSSSSSSSGSSSKGSVAEGVLGALAAIARECLDKTGFFYSGQLARAATKTCFSSRSAAAPAAGAAPPPMTDLSHVDPHASTAAHSHTLRQQQQHPQQQQQQWEEGRRAGARVEQGQVGDEGRSKGGEAASSKGGREDTGPADSGRWVRQPQLQQGVVRTNCLDCLDRTNVAQYVLGREALAQQLCALGVTDSPHLDSKSDVGRRLQAMYIAMGDALALQYGGSAAHNLVIVDKPDTWRTTLHSQELFKSLHRYYSNAITDADKQDAINLFLGHFQPSKGQPAIWDLDSDHHLHGGTGRGVELGERGGVGVRTGLGGRGVMEGGMMRGGAIGAAGMTPTSSESPSLASLPDVSDAPPIDLRLLPSDISPPSIACWGRGQPPQGGSQQCEYTLNTAGGVEVRVLVWGGRGAKGVCRKGEVCRAVGGEVFRAEDWVRELQECGYVFLHTLTPSGATSAAALGSAAAAAAADTGGASSSMGGFRAAYPALRTDGGEESALDLGHACLDGTSWEFYRSYLASVPSLIPGNTLASVRGEGRQAGRRMGMEGAWPLELQGSGALNTLTDSAAAAGFGEGPGLDVMLGGWAVAQAAVEDARRAEEAEEVVKREAELFGGDYGVNVPHVVPSVVCAGLMDGWVAQGQADMRAPLQPLPL
ncbi:hypothetical protein CLOM_g14198 [Closterium sp. NIES-68]|nr:hypothetical protein CLOM_g14198 [Closterium sp. NIES-68]GJP64389.1 hypothetical protein CLOP_g21388 [Closterium sp. NIES-67]